MGISATIFSGKKEMRISMIGLDAAGKTTIIYKLKVSDFAITYPVLNYNFENVQFRNLNITAWDVGGQEKMRLLWRQHFQNTQGLIFVVDSNDRERISETAEELSWILKEDELKEAKLLVFANKQDLPNAMSVAEVTDKLGLHALKNRIWYIQSCCAANGDGLYEGFDWLTKALSSN